MVKKCEIAAAFGITASAVTRYCQRGMPTTSIEAARKWADATLDPVRRIAWQWRDKPGKSPTGELVRHANAVGRLALADYAAHEHELRAALAAVRPLPQALRELVRLDERVWDRLQGFDLPYEGCGLIPLGIEKDMPGAVGRQIVEDMWLEVCGLA